jgi:hypothetical protein
MLEWRKAKQIGYYRKECHFTGPRIIIWIIGKQFTVTARLIAGFSEANNTWLQARIARSAGSELNYSIYNVTLRGSNITRSRFEMHHSMQDMPGYNNGWDRQIAFRTFLHNPLCDRTLEECLTSSHYKWKRSSDNATMQPFFQE